MGCGKTTLGRAVSEAAGMRFIDLDEYIERHAGMTVREIFAKHSEEGFRRLENQTLSEIANKQDTIIACGGGTPCFFDNLETMNRQGTTVFLDVSLSRLHERLKIESYKRPLIARMTDDKLIQYIKDCLAQRMPYYSRAMFSFPADRLDTAEQIAESVASFIARFIR